MVRCTIIRECAFISAYTVSRLIDQGFTLILTWKYLSYVIGIIKCIPICFLLFITYLEIETYLLLLFYQNDISSFLLIRSGCCYRKTLLIGLLIKLLYVLTLTINGITLVTMSQFIMATVVIHYLWGQNGFIRTLFPNMIIFWCFILGFIPSP